METYITLLRGINVSGQKKIKMTDLKTLYEKLGFQDVQTYIQSGNVVFKSAKNKKKVLRDNIEQEISKVYGFFVPVHVLEFSELKTVFINNPFVNNRKEDISKLHVTFLDDIPKNENISTLSGIQYADDEFVVDKTIIYVFCPNGYGRTKLNNNFFEKKLKTTATTRNWKTIGKLIELAN